MIKVTVHQPMYFPYAGFFSKINKSDIFVFLDDAQYSSQYYYNRNLLKSNAGSFYITVPINNKFKQKLNEVKIANNKWQSKHLKSIIANYGKTNYFENYIEYFKEIYEMEWTYLNNINIETTKHLLSLLDIETSIDYSSRLINSDNLSATEKLINICQKKDADVYISGIGGKNYLDLFLFEEAGIKVEFYDYSSAKYNQMFDGFIPNLSIIDMLFNIGSDSKKYI